MKAISKHCQDIIAVIGGYVYTVRLAGGLPVETLYGEACEAVTGYTREELTEDPHLWYRMVMEEDRPAVQAHTERILAGEDPGPLEHRIIRKDGALRWVRNTPVLGRTARGRLTSYGGIIQDITEHKLAQMKLEESEERFKAQYQGNPVPTFTWQRSHGHFVLADYNMAAHVLTGGQVEQFVGKCTAEMYGDRPEIVEDLERCFATRQVLHKEVQSRHFLPGRVLAVTYAFVPPDLVMVHVEDITESRRALEDLKAGEERFRALFENAIEGIYRSSLDGRLLMANPALARMFGYDSPQEAVAGITDIGAQIYADPDERAAVIRRLLKEEEISNYEVAFKRADGTLVWVALNFYLERDASGNPLYIEGTCVDITERKRSEAALRRSQETFLKAFRSSPVIQSISSISDGRFIEVNERFLQTVGYTREEMIGRTSIELGILEAGQRASMRDEIQERGSLHDKEMPFRTRQGELRYGLFSAEIIDLQGQPHLLLMVHDITERKQAEQALKESEERLQAMAGASFEAIFFSENGICFDVNEVATRMFGYSREELIGMRVADLAAPESRDEVLRHVRMKSEEPYTATGMRKDGSRFPTELRGRMFTYRGREVRASSVRDISERVRAEEALRESEEKYRTLVEDARVVVLRWDTSGNITFINEYGLELFGYAEHELVGKSVVGTIVPETESSGRDLAGMIEEICRDPERFSDNENENIARDGRRIWMRWSNKAVLDEAGALAGILSIGSDITLRRHAEDQLRRERDFTANLIESSPAFIVMIEADGRTRMMNRAMLAALGYDADEAIGKRYADTFVPQADHAALAEVFDRMRRAGEMTVNENRVCTRDGRELLIEWHGCPVWREDGGFDCILGIGIDITARKKTEQELQAWMQRYELIVQASGQVAYDYIVPSGQITWGASMEQVLGRTPEEMSGGFGQWLELVHPDDRDETLRALKAAEEACAYWDARYRMRHRNGEYRWIRDRGFFVPGPDGKACRQLGMIEDITAAQKAEAELNYRATLLATLQEASIDGILVVDANGRILSFNRRFIEIWQVPEEILASRRDELALQAVLDTVADPEGFMAKVRSYYAQPSLACRDEVLLADGRILDRYTAPVRGEDGTYYGRVWYFRDVTKEKRAADAIRESEAKYRAIFENAIEGMYQTSPDGRFLSVNPAVVQMFGFDSPEEMLAISDIRHTLYVHPEDRLRLAEILAEQGHAENFEAQVYRRDGTMFWISINARAVRDEQGAIRYYEGSAFDITWSKQAEAALRASEEKYRLVVDNAREAIFIVQDGMFTFVNPFVTEVTGYSAEQLQTTSFIELIHPDDRVLVADWYQRRLRGEAVPEVYTFRIIDRAGDVRWVEIHAILIEWQGRAATLNFVSDITERRLAEQNLEITNKQLADIIEFLPDATLIMDRDKKIIAWNRAMEEMSGVPKAEMLGKDYSYGAVPFYGKARPYLMDLVDKDDQEIAALYRDITRKGALIQAEVFAPALFHGRGAHIWAVASPLLDSEGRIVGAIESVRDITEAKQAEEALRASEEKFRSVVESSPVGMYLYRLETDGRLVLAGTNPAADRIIGIAHQGLLGMTIEEAFPNLAATGVPEMFRKVAKGELGPQNFEISYQDERFAVMNEVTVFQTGPGAIAVEFTDISARKRAQAELEALDRELKRKNQELESIVYATSHDLRSPLLNIQGFGKRPELACGELIRIMQAPEAPPEMRAAAAPLVEETIPKALRFIRSSVEKMDSLIKGLLQLSRLGRAALNMQTVDMAALAHQVAAAMGYQIQEAGAAIEIGDLPLCRCNASQMSQVFSNLIDNALKYRSPERALRVRIEGEVKDGQCIFAVEDNGIGIPVEQREKVWELFHRLEPGGAVAGEGLGLTVVRRIIDRHGGRIWLEDAPAAGCRFCFMIKQDG